MTIQEFADRVGLSAHTLRYYEKIGLFRQVPRDASGCRCFGERDLEWAAFVCRLKDTGMPLRDIRTYADLRAQGDATLAARQALLERHAAALEARLRREADHLAALQTKIAHYRARRGA